LAPLSLLSSLTLTFVTATFRDAFGIPKDTWQAVFILGIVGALIWTARTLWKAFNSRGTQTVEELLVQLKKGAIVQRASVQSESVSASTTSN
jgi:hypothetical protein